jgi:hypothetical protein
LIATDVEPHLHEPDGLVADARRALELELGSTAARSRARAGRPDTVLGRLSKAARTLPLPQRIYRSVEQLGSVEVFLVPIEADGYAAPFM